MILLSVILLTSIEDLLRPIDEKVSQLVVEAFLLQMTSIQKQFTYQVQYNKKTYYDRFLEGASIRLRINLLVLLVQWMDFDHLACPANSVPLNNWCFLLTVSFGSYSICSKADFDKQGFSPHTRKY